MPRYCLCGETIQALFAWLPFHHIHWSLPLQWLQEQKMKGKIARWALALQEFDFSVSYCPGKASKADPISRRRETDDEKQVEEQWSKCTITTVQSAMTEDELRMTQLNDPTLSKVMEKLQNRTLLSTRRVNEWKNTPLLRYAQIADSLSLCNGVLHRAKYRLYRSRLRHIDCGYSMTVQQVLIWALTGH
ncbi:hypothetical protein D918_05179 [Trichuris suis]|nr:hypothetical protein D918_05179 [Trichuris suis]